MKNYSSVFVGSFVDIPTAYSWTLSRKALFWRACSSWSSILYISDCDSYIHQTNFWISTISVIFSCAFYLVIFYNSSVLLISFSIYFSNFLTLLFKQPFSFLQHFLLSLYFFFHFERLFFLEPYTNGMHKYFSPTTHIFSKIFSSTNLKISTPFLILH